MIAFNSPEGVALRALKPSRSALASLWYAALTEDEADWAAWASELLSADPPTAELAGLRFLQAASDGDERKARQFWAVLASFPTEPHENRIIRAARNLRDQMPF